MTKLSTKSGLSKRSLAVYTGYKIRNQEVPVEALRKRLLAKKKSTMETLYIWLISGTEFVGVTYLIT